MNMFLVSFITGLTTGGLSCLAVQGGLLASSLARQLETELPQQLSASHRKNKHKATDHDQSPSAQPILLFLGAKLAAYSMLGFLLGAFGSVLNITVTLRAVLQFAIGIFMIGNALRMLNVHPLFRYFSFEPPAFIRRGIRRASKRGADALTPLFLGALTVFIPCGITQAMMALAITSGNALQGFIILFGFTLGTIPVFFSLAYFTTRLGARFEQAFVKVVAVVILVLGLLAFDSGLTLSGSPFSFNHLSRQVRASNINSSELTSSIAPSDLDDNRAPTLNIPPDMQPASRLVVNATNTGYSPDILRFPAETPFELVLVTDYTLSCTRAFVIPSLGVEAMLPRDGEVVFDIPPQPAGSTLYYTCSMGMYGGMIIFDS